VVRLSAALMPFEITGPDRPFPIVLVPGALSGWVSWKPHAEVLSRDYRVVRVQLLNMAAAERNQAPGGGVFSAFRERSPQEHVG